LDGLDWLKGMPHAQVLLARVIDEEDPRATGGFIKPLITPLASAPQPMARVVETHEQALGRAKDQTQVYLSKLAKKLKCVPATIMADVSDDVVDSTIDIATRENVPMIAMATHVRTGLARSFSGGVSEQVPRHSDVPVLLYRPKVLTD